MLERNARLNILNAVASALSFNVVNQYVGIFAVRLGADNLQLGYLSSWPQVLSVIAVIGAASAITRSEHKKQLIAWILLVGRAAALGLAAVPWFPVSGRIWALIAFWTLAVFPNSAAGTAQQSFLADVFPGNLRGRAFASRNAWATGAGMVSILIVGWLLDYLFPYPLGYQIIFALSFVVALAEIWFFLGMRETVTAEGAAARAPAGSGGVRSYLRVFHHRPFLLLLLVSIPFNFTWQLAWPIFTRFQVTDLGADNTWLSLLTVAQSLVMMVTYPVWAKYSERYGNMRMMLLAAINIATAPILTAMVPSVQWLILVNLWTGIGVSGVTLLLLNIQLDLSPADERPVFLAVHAALVAVSASIAPIVGAWLMSVLPARYALGLSSLPRLITGLCFVFLISLESQRKGKRGQRAKFSNPSSVADSEP